MAHFDRSRVFRLAEGAVRFQVTTPSSGWLLSLTRFGDRCTDAAGNETTNYITDVVMERSFRRYHQDVLVAFTALSRAVKNMTMKILTPTTLMLLVAGAMPADASGHPEPDLGDFDAPSGGWSVYARAHCSQSGSGGEGEARGSGASASASAGGWSDGTWSSGTASGPEYARAWVEYSAYNTPTGTVASGSASVDQASVSVSCRIDPPKHDGEQELYLPYTVELGLGGVSETSAAFTCTSAPGVESHTIEGHLAHDLFGVAYLVGEREGETFMHPAGAIAAGAPSVHSFGLTPTDVQLRIDYDDDACSLVAS